MYNNRFFIQYNNDLGELIEIYFAYKDYTDDVTELKAASDCLTVKNTGGDEDKLFGICGQEAYIKFIIPVNDTVSIDDFVSVHDLDIQVTVYLNRRYDRSIFQGFIVVEDNGQPFLDPPYVVSVRALDGLGLLKGVYFYNTNGKVFTGKQSIVSWLCQILNQTGQSLKIRTYFNLRNENFVDSGNPLEQTFIDAITFTQGNQTPAGDNNPADFSTGFVDYYTALEYIVRNFRAKLFQDNGCWHFVSLLEYINPDGYSYYEYEIGAPVSGIVTFTQTGAGTNKKYDISVAKNDIVFPINSDQMQYLKLAYKSIELVYNYDQSLNKICNQNLFQGVAEPSHDEVISSAIIDTTIQPIVNLNTFGFDTFCFDNFKGNIITGQISAYPSNVNTGSVFTRSVKDELNYDIDRFMVIKQPSAGDLICSRTQRLLIDTADILQISFSFRTRTSASVSLLAVCFVYLYGDDGTYWAMQGVDDGTFPGNPTIWRQVNSNFRDIPTDQGSYFCEIHPTGDLNTWQFVSINTGHDSTHFFAKVPVSGQLEIIFFNEGPGSSSEVWIKDISIVLLPYLNGTYKQLQGDYNFSSQTNNIKQTISQQVQISDSPKRYFKGALFSSASGLTLLPAKWYLPGNPTTLFRFTQLMEYVMYSNVYRMLYKIEGTFKEFVYPDEDLSTVLMVGMLNTYYFPNSKWPTKRFMCTSLERDFNKGTWRAVFIETRSDINDLGVKTPDLFIFDYLFQSS